MLITANDVLAWDLDSIDVVVWSWYGPADSSHHICHIGGCLGGCEDIDKWDDLEEVCNAVDV